ncbi:MAG: hypothetical protein R2813_13265 [Flavobacteriales bacterium]
MTLHDEGKYELSLIEYRKALELDPKNTVLLYEMALSHYYLGERLKAEDFALQASKTSSETGMQAYILLGSIYDESGKPKKSINIYEKAIKEYGDYYLLWFNMGVTAMSMKDYDLAGEAFMHSANNRLDHANSHYALGSVMQIQSRRVEAMIPIYFFLLLEANTDRSVQAFTTLNDLWKQGVSSSESGVSIDLNEATIKSRDPFGPAETLVSLIQAHELSVENEGKTEFELYVEKLDRLFSLLPELDFGKRHDFYTQYYIPFFGTIAESEYMETFVYYITQSSFEESKQWVNSHTEELAAFFDWLDENE